MLAPRRWYVDRIYLNTWWSMATMEVTLHRIMGRDLDSEILLSSTSAKIFSEN